MVILGERWLRVLALSSWPIVGSSHKSAKDGLVVAFRAFTVDTSNCGGVDFLGTMSGAPLWGSVQLWDQRTNFANSGTRTQITCPLLPAPTGEQSMDEVDAPGNGK